MNYYLLRKARKLCQMSLGEVAGHLGCSVTFLGDRERGTEQFTQPTLDTLWDFYEKHEKPSRFEGSKTVRELRQEFYKVIL